MSTEKHSGFCALDHGGSFCRACDGAVIAVGQSGKPVDEALLEIERAITAYGDARARGAMDSATHKAELLCIITAAFVRPEEPAADSGATATGMQRHPAGADGQRPHVTLSEPSPMTPEWCAAFPKSSAKIINKLKLQALAPKVAAEMRSELAYIAAYDLEELEDMTKDRLVSRASTIISRARRALAPPARALAEHEQESVSLEKRLMTSALSYLDDGQIQAAAHTLRLALGKARISGSSEDSQTWLEVSSPKDWYAWIATWMGEHDVVLPNEAYKRLKGAFRTLPTVKPASTAATRKE